MNEEQLKKDKELLKEWDEVKTTMTFRMPDGSPQCVVCGLRPDKIDDLLEAQKRVTAEEIIRRIFGDIEPGNTKATTIDGSHYFIKNSAGFFNEKEYDQALINEALHLAIEKLKLTVQPPFLSPKPEQDETE